MVRQLSCPQLSACLPVGRGSWACSPSILAWHLKDCLPDTALLAGLESIYFWEGKVQSDEELLLKIKTRKQLLPELTAQVKALHPYTECEVTAVDVTGGSDTYLQWIRDSAKEG